MKGTTRCTRNAHAAWSGHLSAVRLFPELLRFPACTLTSTTMAIEKTDGHLPEAQYKTARPEIKSVNPPAISAKPIRD
jgi:hypothetical protein